jgi:hypothetical protein
VCSTAGRLTEGVPISANFLRKPRKINALQAFCVPSDTPVESTISTPATPGSTHFMDLPAFDGASDPDLAERVEWWNAELDRAGLDLRVGVMASKEIRLSEHRWWWF